MISAGVVTQEEGVPFPRVRHRLKRHFLPIGMMIIVNITGKTGLLEWLLVG
jgi:hypothetical protein